jgi:hypothetical protein
VSEPPLEVGALEKTSGKIGLFQSTTPSAAERSLQRVRLLFELFGLWPTDPSTHP